MMLVSWVERAGADLLGVYLLWGLPTVTAAVPVCWLYFVLESGAKLQLVLGGGVGSHCL